MQYSKQIALSMLDTHWVTDTLEFPASTPLYQIILVPRKREEIFPGLTDEVKAFVASDTVTGLQGVAIDKGRRVITLSMAPAAGAHTEDSA